MPENPITLARIEAVAPDQASLNAARKLLKANKWPSREMDAEGRLLWGACLGSGASAYRVAVEVADLGAKCSCPSRKFPCKHAIALMWWMAEHPDDFSVGEVPDWVTEWQGRRRRNTTPDKDDKNAPAKSAAAALESAPSKPKDPKRAAAQRERTRKARETSIRQGLDELDVWIADQIDRGFGTFGAQATEQCRLLSQRMVDAKAGGIATLIESLPTRYYRAPEAYRYDALLEALGTLHLLAQAYRRQDELAGPLREEVRRRVGWIQTRDELLNAETTERVSGSWIVLANRRETQPDRLIRIETWLVTANPESPRFAALLDFVPMAAASSAAAALEPGTMLEAELAFYPSNTPLRAQVVSQESSRSGAEPPKPSLDLAGALDRFDEVLGCNPWMDQWPIAFDGVRVCRTESGDAWVTDRNDSVVLPIQGEEATLLVGLDDLQMYATFDGRSLSLLAANSELGPLWSAL